MNDSAIPKGLSFTLYVIGAIFVVGILPMMNIWPAGWTWTPRQPEYEQMLLGVYATLGVFLILAAKDPLAHRSLINFTIWSSVVHAGIMLMHAIIDKSEQTHMIGDVPALLLVAIILWLKMPKAEGR